MPFFTALAVGLAIGGIGLQAYGQHKAGQAAEAAGKAQAAASESEAQLSDFNAHIADLQAQDAVDRGTLAEDRFRAQVRGMGGQQRVGFAASNVDVGYGSAADVQQDTAHLGELDALTIRTNAAREAWGYQVNAADLRTKAEILRKTGTYQELAGEQAATNANVAAGATIATGAGSLLMTKYGFGKAA